MFVHQRPHCSLHQLYLGQACDLKGASSAVSLTPCCCIYVLKRWRDQSDGTAGRALALHMDHQVRSLAFRVVSRALPAMSPDCRVQGQEYSPSTASSGPKTREKNERNVECLTKLNLYYLQSKSPTASLYKVHYPLDFLGLQADIQSFKKVYRRTPSSHS